MSNFQEQMDNCTIINRFANLLSKGNIYNLDFDQQEYILENNINANYLLTFDEWNDKGARILKGSKSIRLPKNKMVFDVNQTNYKQTSDEEFPRLVYDLNSSDSLENLNTILSSFIPSQDGDIKEQYINIVYGIIQKRFNNIDFDVQYILNNPEEINLKVLSDTTNKVFNLFKSIYNKSRYTSNDLINLSDILQYAINNNLGGPYEQNGINREYENENGLSRSQSTMDLAEDEGQWNTLSTPTGDSGILSGVLDSDTVSFNASIQQETSRQSIGQSIPVFSSSQGDSSGRSLIQTGGRGLDEIQSDENIAFLNDEIAESTSTKNSIEQISLFDSIQAINTAEFNDNLVDDITDDIEKNQENIFKDSDRLSSKSFVIGSQYIENVINNIDNIPLQNKTFDELSEEERIVVNDDDSLYLNVYNNTVDKMYTITDEMKEYFEKYPYGSQDGIKDPNNIKVLAKWFSPVGAGTWIATEFDGYDYNGDPYLYGCASLGYGWEWGMLPTFSELKSIDLGSQFGHLRIEKDMSVNVGDSLYDVFKSTDYSGLSDLGFNQALTTDSEEINNVIRRGSGFQEGKFRIYQYFKNNEAVDNKKRADFLKNEYGIGGYSGPRTYNSRLRSYSSDSKGLSISLYDDMQSYNETQHTLSWSDVANRIDFLIDNNLYFLGGEYDEYNNWLNKDNNVLSSDSLNQNDIISAKQKLIDFLKTDEMIESLNLLHGYTGINTTVSELENSLEKPAKTREEVLNENIEFEWIDGLDEQLDSFLQDYDITKNELAKHRDELIDFLSDPYYGDGSEWEDVSYENQIKFAELAADYLIEEFDNSIKSIDTSKTIHYDDLGVKVEINDIVYSYSDDWKNAHPLQLTNLVTGETEIIDEHDNRSKELIDKNSDNNDIEIKFNPVSVNYKINDIDIGVGTPLERFNNNIEAIRVLHNLETENRNATSEEQDILAKYVGWGGLADFFDNSKRPEQNRVLQHLLSNEEYNSARESTLSAFYTQPIIIDSIYKALDKFGFEKGNILEPSCGVGNFFGRLPDKLSDSKLYGVELDSLSARIAKKLYPNANIQQKGYEDTLFDDNFFDVAIGNVPFGDFNVMDKRYDKYNLKIHDYFFAKTIDKVKPGGVIAFITSKGTMDKLNSKAREYISERCDLLGAIRLPKEAFKAAAGTETVSDIIFLSKRSTPRVHMPSWTKSSDKNFMHIEYFDKYMSKDELENQILEMLYNKDFDNYNKIIQYCEDKEEETNNWFYGRKIDPNNYIETEFNTRYVYTRDNVINRWKNHWSNKYGNVSSNYTYSLYSYGDIELYRWFVDDPDAVIKIVADSGKFNTKAKTQEERIDLAREYLTVSDESIMKKLKTDYVDNIVDYLTNHVAYLDEKQGKLAQPINNYFAENKNMIIGEPSITTSRFGFDLDISLSDTDQLESRLDECIDNINYQYIQENIEAETKQTKENIKVVPANMNIANFTYGIVNDEIYYRTNSVMQLIPSSTSNYDLLKDSIILKDEYKSIIEAQLNGIDDVGLKQYQEKLNKTYDEFVEKHGRLCGLIKKFKNFVDNDSSIERIVSLEVVNQDTKSFSRKADIFSERTIHSQNTIIDHCESSLDALLVSLQNRLSVDLDLMSKLTDKSKDEIINELKGTIFKNHLNEDEYLPADEYLSGNVKQKHKEVNNLIIDIQKQISKEEDEETKHNLQSKLEWLNDNLAALNDSLPKDLLPFEIDMPLGASWIPERVIQQFVEHVILDGNFYSWNRPVIKRSNISKNWYIENKTRVYDSANLIEKYGLNVKGHNALDIVESCLNLKREEVAFYVEQEDGKKVRVVDKQKTLLAIQKQELIKREFAKWVKENDDISDELAQIYNNRFNCIVDRKYNPDLIAPVGMSNKIDDKEIQLYSHQKEAIAKALFGGNTGVFHAVGAGKTLTLITIAMEAKRLGLANKSLFVVPKNIVGQWGKNFYDAYPNANILVADEKSFTKDNRRRFINKIASGNYDAIIISNEQFKLLKLSDERVTSYIQEDIDRIQSFLAEQRSRRGKSDWSVKQAESVKKKLETRIKKQNEMKKDDYINFEELGIDKLFIDESHNFKNLSFETSLGRVKGIGSSADAQKSNDLYYKTRYLNQLTNNKGIVFATGTPISNYLAEMFTIQRYLQPDVLRSMDVDNFDSWVSVFGEIVEEQQLDVTGTKYTPKAVLKRYHNLPELMTAFRQVADIRTKDTLDLELPDVERINIEVPRTEQQKLYLDDLNDRIDLIRNNQVDPSEDNMLLITNDGRKMALDQRLVDMDVSEGQKLKVDYVIDNVYQEYVSTSDKKGTQSIFSDLSTPGDKWNVYKAIKDGLIAKGIPADEIQFVHDYEKQKDKVHLVNLINDGKVRIVLGSTKKLGTGTNMQEKMTAIHHIDVPWKPSDIEQREGRAIRQGNSNDNVKIYRYITADTFDAYSWQIIENKATFISQIMTNKNPARSCDDLDDDGLVLDAAQIKAIATGNPLIKERMTLENDIKKLTISKQDHLRSISSLKENVSVKLPNQIANTKDKISRLQHDISLYVKPDIVLTDDNKQEYALDITINNKKFNDYKEAGDELHRMCNIVKWPDDRLSLTYFGKTIGKYQDFDIKVGCGENVGDFIYVIGNKWTTTVKKYESPINQIKQLISSLDSLESKLEYQQATLDNTLKDLENSKVLVDQPFEFEDELKHKQDRLKEIVESMENDSSYSSNENLDNEKIVDENGNSMNNHDDEDDLDDDYDNYKGEEL